MCRQLQLSVWALLIVACGREEAYDRAIREQHANALAIVDAQQRAQEEQLARGEEQRAERLQDAHTLESDPPDILSEDQLHQLFEDYYCGDCHFGARCPSCELGGFYLDTVQEMIREHTLIPGNAEGSPVIERMRRHLNPLPDLIPPPSEAAIQLVADFINQLPVPDAGSH